MSRNSVGALIVANARFWPSVAPHVRTELQSWGAAAASIPDPTLQQLAVEKWRGEAFNAEVAATLATLTPCARRAGAVRAIVALELLFDYLDGRTESPTPCHDPVTRAERLMGPLVDAVAADVTAHATGSADGEYLSRFALRVRRELARMPAAEEVRPVALEAARRCVAAQARAHSVGLLGKAQLREWATVDGHGSGVGWREYLAGSASSVLAMHALIAAAGDPHTTRAQAEQLDRAYLTIGALISLLDSVVDRREDLATGAPGFIGLYDGRDELLDAMVGAARLAMDRIAETSHAAHHAMTLAGVVAYYTSHEGARDAYARPIVDALRRELSPTIWPTLAVMSAWRGAKRVRSAAMRR